MFNATRILVSTLVVAMVGILLSACGQTGPLYLPPVSRGAGPASNPSPAPQTQEIATPPAL
ncbi:MAG: lipoprotein [Rhodoferax sp.]|nr:lipoprotein [Rhodoferax sp.]